MKIDYIDLYQVHWPDPQTPFEDTAGYLQELVDEGKIRHVGVSNFDEQQMAAFDRDRARRDAAAALPPLPPVGRGADLALRPRARHRRAGLQPARLGPAHRHDDRGHDLRRRRLALPGVGVQRRELPNQPAPWSSELKEFAAEKGIEVSQLAIAWVLAQPEVDVAIVGARSRRNIERSLAAVDVELTADDLAQIDHITMDGVEVQGATPGGRRTDASRGPLVQEGHLHASVVCVKVRLPAMADPGLLRPTAPSCPPSSSGRAASPPPARWGAPGPRAAAW